MDTSTARLSIVCVLLSVVLPLAASAQTADTDSLAAGGPLDRTPENSRRAPAHEPVWQESRYSGEDLETVGRVRMVSLLDGILSFSSIDGSSRTYSLGPWAPPGRPRLDVQVDGVPVDLSVLGRTSLELLPIVPGRIQSLSLSSAPGPTLGQPSFDTRLSIRTTPPEPGWTLSGAVIAGNPEGDPGPYRYTDKRSPNVDRTGPSYGVYVARAGAKGGIGLGLQGDEYHATDPAIVDRVNALYRGERKPILRTTVPTLSLWWSSDRTWHRLLAGYAVHESIEFLRPLGQELPLTRRSAFATSAGQFGLGKRWGLQYAIQGQRIDLDPRANRQNFSMDWAQERFSTSFGLSRGASGLTLGVRHRTTITSSSLTDRSVSLPYAVASIVWKAPSSTRHHLVSRIIYSDEDPTRSARFLPGFRYVASRETEGSSLSVLASLVSEPLEWSDDEAFWLLRGWTYPGAGRDRVDLPPYVLDPKTISLGIAWERMVSEQSRVGMHVTWNRYLGGTLPMVSLVPDPAKEDLFVGSYSVRTGVGGSVMTARLFLAQDLRENFRQEASLELSRPLSGEDRTFWQHWAPLPRYQARYQVIASPVSRVHLSFRMSFQSATIWPDFPDPVSDKPLRLAPRLRMDAAASKDLWGPRLSVFARLEHLSGTSQRTHPVGAEERLTFFVGVFARFDRGGRK